MNINKNNKKLINKLMLLVGIIVLAVIMPSISFFVKIDNVNAYDEGFSGQVSGTDIIYIDTADDLKDYLLQEDNFNDATFVLLNDIDLGNAFTGEGCHSIGRNLRDSFSGRFYGNGHTISFTNINYAAMQYNNAGVYENSVMNYWVGLFGYIDSTGAVYDLNVEGNLILDPIYTDWATGIEYDHSVIGAGNKAEDIMIYAGGIAGVNNGLIENCTFTGNIQESENCRNVAYGSRMQKDGCVWSAFSSRSQTSRIAHKLYISQHIFYGVIL